MRLEENLVRHRRARQRIALLHHRQAKILKSTDVTMLETIPEVDIVGLDRYIALSTTRAFGAPSIQAASAALSSRPEHRNLSIRRASPPASTNPHDRGLLRGGKLGSGTRSSRSFGGYSPNCRHNRRTIAAMIACAYIPGNLG
jgi:hypothetical protein